MISAPAAPRCRRQLLVAIGRPRAPPPSVNGAGMTTCAQARSEHGVMGGDQGVIAGGGACGATSGAAGALWGARAVRTRSPHLRRPSEACRERRPAPALHPREEGASLTAHFLFIISFFAFRLSNPSEFVTGTLVDFIPLWWRSRVHGATLPSGPWSNQGPAHRAEKPLSAIALVTEAGAQNTSSGPSDRPGNEAWLRGTDESFCRFDHSRGHAPTLGFS